MKARRARFHLVAFALLGALATSCDPSPSPPASPSVEVPTEDLAEQARGGDADLEEALEELEEQEERTELREAALEEAVAAGLFGRIPPGSFTPVAGWTGQRVMDPRYDDWEPAVAADPKRPYVYILSTRYGASSTCKEPCSSPFIALEVSKDGGATWSGPRPLCACPGAGQFDPIIEVVPATGDVYAVYMRGYHVVFVRSDDHGRSWSDPVPTLGKVAWNDKPVMTTSRNGRDVFVSWNGPSGGDPYVAQSHDGGRTWTQTQVGSSGRYFFAYDATVTPDGTVVFAESSMVYGPGSSVISKIRYHAIVSKNGGRTWKIVNVASVPRGQPCADCREDFYLGHASVSTDRNGRLVYAYDGAVEEDGPQRIFVRWSQSGGRRWSDKVRVSDVAEHSSSPMLEARGDGDVRLVYMQTSGGGDVDRWNAWYRRSKDGGRTWTAPKDISDRPGGAAYKHPDGFEEIYGDYGEIAITSTGETFAAWGESFSYVGPGSVWFNRTV